ncbi:MAG: hypothetical protein LBB47_00530, partial [Spirochaetaceae bacterium]|nr:hypothetical protein [Spirochaetaceae bacterium]
IHKIAARFVPAFQPEPDIYNIETGPKVIEDGFSAARELILNLAPDLGKSDLDLGKSDLDLGKSDLDLGKSDLDLGKSNLDLGKSGAVLGVFFLALEAHIYSKPNIRRNQNVNNG